MAGALYGQNAMSLAMAPSTTSPGQSSPESFDVEEDSIAAPGQWQTSPSSGSQAQRAPAPLQKRRRVTRACDECRRKKIKCDGKQPCTHCTVYSYDCTYDQPSNRRRNPAPQYIEALETRLQRAETLLRTVLPNVDLNDPNIDSIIQKRHLLEKGKEPVAAPSKPADGADSEGQEGQLRSMIESTGQLDLDDNGHWDFHGGSSGIVFIKRMREQFGGLLGTDPKPFLPKLPRPYPSVPMFDSPKPSGDSPFESGLPNTLDLPPRATARALCDDSLNFACALLRFVHIPVFYEMMDRIYDVPPENFGDDENRFLPLLYVVLALGCMFRTDPSEEHGLNNYKASIDQGLKYFRAARGMLDITDCRDITSLQAVLFMILFLQSSANLSTCYSYIGIALRSSLRMGLHRNIVGQFNPIERESRRRVFWIVRKMDTYVSALLGFPQMLSSDDIDQELPIEVDDEYITEEAVLPMPAGKISQYAASNAHTRLMNILAKVIKYIYPIKGVEQSVKGSSGPSYVISHAKIKEIERDLADWLDKLPMALRPGGEGPTEVVRVQQLLRLAYAHVQMMLYRPFLHYVSQSTGCGKSADDRSYACAAACVSVSRNVVHITTEMKKRGLLIGAYWFTMYTTFFAILSLVFFVLENPDKPGSQEILADAADGHEALKGLAQRSQAADRCAMALKGLFEQLPERLKTGGAVGSKKKRSAPESSQPRQGVPSAPKTFQVDDGPPIAMISRATTFPVSGNVQAGKPQRSSLDGKRLQNNTLSNQNLRQSFHDYMSPATVGTPESSTSSNIPQQAYPQQPQFGNNNMPDLGAMMFPSADPFAYPNQPMMEYDNVKQENMMMGNQNSQMFLSNGAVMPPIYDDLEGQLFGPVPPYLMHGQPNMDLQSHMNGGGNTMGGLNPPDLGYHTGLIPNNEMNFDAIFTDAGGEWGNMLAEQRYRQ